MDAATPRLAGLTPRQAYDEVRQTADRVRDRGDLPGARRLYEEAVELAAGTGDPDLRDRALCNLAGVAVELSDGTSVMGDLREILMKNRDEMNCYLAAYTLARAHELAQSYKKALFYARIALDRVSRLSHPKHTAACHNLMGNLLLAESFVDDAREQYQRALATSDDLPLLRTALILDNLGYCRLLEGRHSEGFTLAFRSLRILRRLGARAYQRYPRISLAFGYLEIGRYDRAIRHGFAALRLAEEVGDNQEVKNCLFLLGEAARLLGSPEDARRCFESLQRRFYSEHSHLVDALMAVEVRGLLNLRA